MKTRRATIRMVLLGVFLVSWLTVLLSGKQHGGSSFISHPQGTKALFLLLDRVGLEPERFRKPFTALSGTNKILFIISPETMGHEGALLGWIERGNTVLYFDARPGEAEKLYKLLGMKEREGANAFDEYLEQSRSASFLDEGDTRANISGEMTAPGPHGFLPPVEAVPLLKVGGEIRAFRLTLGGGRFYFFSDASAIENERLDRAENLKLILALVRSAEGILFDEFHHGFTAPAPARAQARIDALFFFVAMLVLWMILGALSRAVRFGPAVEEVPEPPAATEAYVSALGLLCFDHTAATALRRFAQGWRERVEAAYGISTGLSHGQCAANLVQRGLLPAERGNELARSLSLLETLPDGDTRIHDQGFWSRAFSTMEEIFSRNSNDLRNTHEFSSRDDIHTTRRAYS